VLTLPFLAVAALGVDELELLAGVLEERLS
jgi:hypothetical protein